MSHEEELSRVRELEVTRRAFYTGKPKTRLLDNIILEQSINGRVNCEYIKEDYYRQWE